MIVRSITLYIKPGKIQEFIKATIENQNKSRKENGVHAFEFFQCQDDETKFMLYEVYESQEVNDKHLNSNHFKKWASTVEDYFSAERDRVTYISITPIR